VTVCAGCNKEESLVGSHIIPEFFYKYVYTNDHKFVEITPENKDDLETKQKGLREPLLCRACEQVFSKFEAITADFVRQISSGNLKSISVQQLSPDILLINKHNYDAIKRCLLSILWRASVSRLDTFSEYDLAAHSDRVKSICFGNSSIPWHQYPIVVTKLKLGNLKTVQLMMLHRPGNYKNKTLYSMTLAGFNFDFFVDDDFADKEAELISMKPQDMAIRSIQLNDLNVSEGFLDRFKDDDVRIFYEKHK